MVGTPSTGNGVNEQVVDFDLVLFVKSVHHVLHPGHKEPGPLFIGHLKGKPVSFLLKLFFIDFTLFRHLKNNILAGNRQRRATLVFLQYGKLG